MQKRTSWMGLTLLFFLVAVLASPAQSQRPAQRVSAGVIPNAALVKAQPAGVGAKAESVEPLGEWRVVPLEGHGPLLWREAQHASDDDPRHIYYIDVDEASLEMRIFEYSGTNPAHALRDLEADLGIAVRESLPEERPIEELAPSLKGSVPGYWAETLESSASAIETFAEIIDFDDCKEAIDAALPVARSAGVASQAALVKKICVRSTPWSPWVGGPINVRSIPTGGGGVNCLWSQSWTRTATFSCSRIVCGFQVWAWTELRTQKVLKTVSSGPHLPPYTCPAVPPGGMPTP